MDRPFYKFTGVGADHSVAVGVQLESVLRRTGDVLDLDIPGTADIGCRCLRGTLLPPTGLHKHGIDAVGSKLFIAGLHPSRPNFKGMAISFSVGHQTRLT